MSGEKSEGGGLGEMWEFVAEVQLGVVSENSSTY